MTRKEIAQLVRHTLRVFCQPKQAVELRALGVAGCKAICEIFTDLDDLATKAAIYDEQGAKGCYFTPNPLDPSLAPWKYSKIKASDAIERRWFLIDCDPYRPAGTNASAAELEAARQVMENCRTLTDRVFEKEPVVGCSGNGWHLCYPIQMDNDKDSKDLLKAALIYLQRRCGYELTPEEKESIKNGRFLTTPRAAVDCGCFDATRIWKLYGTMARKGPPTPERPHRRAYLPGSLP